MSWITPKTIWVTTDRFNIEDYNRIKNNIAYLCTACEMASAVYGFEDMGDDIVTYDPMWDYTKFNAMENNLERITTAWTPQSVFIHKTYYPGGKFIDASELSRIESVSLSLYAIAKSWEDARLRMPFRLGGERKVRV